MTPREVGDLNSTAFAAHGLEEWVPSFRRARWVFGPFRGLVFGA